MKTSQWELKLIPYIENYASHNVVRLVLWYLAEWESDEKFVSKWEKDPISNTGMWEPKEYPRLGMIATKILDKEKENGKLKTLLSTRYARHSY